MVCRKDLKPTEYATYFEPYINSIAPDGDMLSVLKQTLTHNIEFVKFLDKSLDLKYGDGKWSIGELLTHCIDTERIFQYRALSFMRSDPTDLAGFDQDLYVTGLKDYAFAKASIIKSMEIVRASTIDLFENTTLQALLKMGKGSGNYMSVRAIPFVICGHWNHHLSIIDERY